MLSSPNSNEPEGLHRGLTGHHGISLAIYAAKGNKPSD